MSTQPDNPAGDVPAPVDHRRIYLTIFLFLVLGATLLSNHLQTEHSEPVQPIAQRKPMPAVALQQLGGGVWSLAEHRGQVVLLNYWATWCEPCRDEIPGLSKLARDNPQRLAIVGVSLDSGPNLQASLQQFVKLYRMPYPIAFPNTLIDRSMGDTGIPITVLVDKQGRIAKIYSGATARTTFARDIATLTAEN
jgi:thiol-disulfide isomerase/thioredoxin